MNKQAFADAIRAGKADHALRILYGASPSVLESQHNRYLHALRRFSEIFPDRDDIRLFSAPGRTEIGGNHTDHQHGCALAAAVNLDVIAVVAFHDEGVIRFDSEGHGRTETDLADLSVREDEKGTSAALIRGIAAKFAAMGVKIGGFDAFSVSDVLSGSGLSSSAAFETLIGTIINVAYNHCNADEAEIAKIGQYAENVYFGKGSGLLDQTVCAYGGFVFIDFLDTEKPYVEKYRFDFESAGYHLCITDTKGSHADLTEDYVAVPREMKSVAAQFGKEYLREVDEFLFLRSIPSLRGKCSDRAIMRAVHYFKENRRAIDEAQALDNGDIDRFFDIYRRSAASSANLLQNHYANAKPTEQGISLGIMMSRLILGDDAAVRVHGGGFAGTIQAFVPTFKTEEYVRKMNALYGAGSCYVLRIRPVGGAEITA
ncbi:MAG: galactokinase [Ruminococcus sp.]|nr:galactokinase [Ruminococcus sp.]